MFDLLFVLVVGSSTLFAALRGCMRETLTLIALAVAGLLSWITVPGLISAFGLGGKIIPTVAIAGVLLVVFFVVAHLGMHLLLARYPVTGVADRVDHTFGGIFGFLRGLVLIGLVFLGLTYVLGEEQQPEAVQTAMTRPIAASVASWLDGFAPSDTKLESIIDYETDDASVQGYRRIDRNGIEEIVTTVTTDETSTSPTPSQETESVDDAIAEILSGDEDQ